MHDCACDVFLPCGADCPRAGVRVFRRRRLHALVALALPPFAHRHARGAFEEALEEYVVGPSALLGDERDWISGLAQKREGAFEAVAVDLLED